MNCSIFSKYDCDHFVHYQKANKIEFAVVT